MDNNLSDSLGRNELYPRHIIYRAEQKLTQLGYDINNIELWDWSYPKENTVGITFKDGKILIYDYANDQIITNEGMVL